ARRPAIYSFLQARGRNSGQISVSPTDNVPNVGPPPAAKPPVGPQARPTGREERSGVQRAQARDLLLSSSVAQTFNNTTAARAIRARLRLSTLHPIVATCRDPKHLQSGRRPAAMFRPTASVKAPSKPRAAQAPHHDVGPTRSATATASSMPGRNVPVGRATA